MAEPGLSRLPQAAITFDALAVPAVAASVRLSTPGSHADPWAPTEAVVTPLGVDGWADGVLAGAGHGSVMLAREPDLATALVDWFIRTLL